MREKGEGRKRERGAGGRERERMNKWDSREGRESVEIEDIEKWEIGVMIAERERGEKGE